MHKTFAGLSIIVSLLHPLRSLRESTRGLRKFVRITLLLFQMTGRGMRYSIVALQFFNVAGAIINLLSTLSIVPFLAMIVQPNRTQNNRWVRAFQDALGIETQEMLIVAMGTTSLVVLCVSHAISIALAIVQMRLQDYLRLSVYDKMTKHYFSHDYEFHLQTHSAVLLQNMMGRAESIINNLLQASFKLVENIIYIALGIMCIFIANAYLALPVTVLLFASIWIGIQRSQANLRHHQKKSMKQDIRGGVLSLDALRNIESIQMSGRWKYFSDRVWELRKLQAQHQRRIQTINMLFKPFLEIPLAAVVVGSIIITVLTFGDSLRVLVSLAVFGLVCYRLMPRVNQLLPLYIKIQRGMINFDFVGEDLVLAFQRSFPPRPKQRMKYEKNLCLENICYAYPNTNTNAVDDLSLEIPHGSSVGICGNTGSGKSTLVKLLLGLLKTHSGRILIDGVELNPDNLPTWQNLMGYVSQSNTLLSLDFTENIALGIPPDKIDKSRIRQVLKEAELYDFVKSLPKGMRTQIGEQGQQLSGGQCQRVAIARALYSQPEVLVFDEATSSLDGATERAVVDTIYHLGDEKRTLIMVAHRLSTLERCDFLVLMENGTIVEQGSYQELAQNSPRFQRLATLDIEEKQEPLETSEVIMEPEPLVQQEPSPGTRA